MEESLKIALLISETVAAGIAAQVIASYLQLPTFQGAKNFSCFSECMDIV